MRRRTIALAAVVLLIGTAGTVRAQGIIHMYEDDGPFVEGPAMVFGMSLLGPVMVVAGTACAPVAAVLAPHALVSKTIDCALVPGILAGVGGYVGGAPFKAIKTVFWDLPVGDARRGPRPAVAPPPKPPTPAEPPTPSLPDVEIRG